MKKILIGSYILIIIIIIYCIANNRIFDTKNAKAVASGEKLYNQSCIYCHGETGKGEGKNAGTALNNQNFLNSVTDRDIYNYMKYGREGTGMPAYGQRLSEEELNSLVSFIRNWQKEEIDFKTPKTIAGDPERGREQYNLYCIQCHGESGAGILKMGSALSHPKYLQYTTDEQIWIATAYGREETRMAPSLKGYDGARQLTEQEISDIIVYLRSFEKK